MICGGLLIAAPLAIVFSGGDPQAGGTREPGGVFISGPDDGTGTGTGGTGGTGGSLATTASQTPAPPASGPAAGVDPASEVGGAVPPGSGSGLATGGGASGGVGTVGQPGTAAGAPAPVGQQPAQQQPAQQQPAPPAPQQPAPQQPAPAPTHAPTGAPCPCQIVNGVLTSVTRLVPTQPLPKLPVSPLG